MSTFRGIVLGRQESLAVQRLWKTPLQPGICTPGRASTSEDGTVVLQWDMASEETGIKGSPGRAREKLRDRAAQLFLLIMPINSTHPLRR